MLHGDGALEQGARLDAGSRRFSRQVCGVGQPEVSRVERLADRVAGVAQREELELEATRAEEGDEAGAEEVHVQAVPL